jgi:hypothetical protein
MTNIINNDLANISEYLLKITDKNKYSSKQIFDNLKNCLIGYNANIYSCGTSFNEFKDIMPINPKTIKICIKGTFNKILKPDIFIFDDRINAGGRVNDKFNIDNVFKIYFGDYFFDNYLNHVTNLSNVYNFPKQNKNFLNPNLILTPCKNYSDLTFIEINDIKILNEINNLNNVIYGNYNIYIPLIYKILCLFKYMGINQFNLTGVDIISSDFSQKHYFENNVKINQIGYDTFIYLYYDYLLDYSKFNVKLYSNFSNANISIPRYKKIDMSYHIINKLNNIKINKNLIKSNQLIYLKFVQLIVNEKINIILPGKVFNFNDVNIIIKILKKNNIPVNFNNILLLHKDININLLPDNFYSKIYKILNTDLENLDKFQLITHYVNHGIKENRKYKCENIPKDFDYNKYKNLNPDLKNMDRIQLIVHYENHGYKENRRYK